MWLSYLHLNAKRNLIIFEYDEVTDILVWLPSDFYALKKMSIIYSTKNLTYRYLKRRGGFQLNADVSVTKLLVDKTLFNLLIIKLLKFH